LEGKPAVTRKEARAPAKRAAAKKARRRGTGTEVIRNQLRALRSIDEGVGRILEALERAGRLDETLVIFTSDNGYFWGEHGLGDKRWAYEESIRIPLLMRLPGLIEAGSTIDRIALNVDIAPTLLDVAGVAIPADFHGRSLVPLLRGEAIPWREAMLAEYVQEERYPQTPSWQAVRTGRWKLIRYTELEGMDELYDLRADPHELRNLIREPDARSALEALEAELARLRDATR
jgi:N-acetylglucosamine-6-sulfatase